MIAGDRDIKNQLQEKCKDIAIFRGRVSADKLRKAYAGVKVLIFSGAEDCCIVSLEAQAAGTPVIAFGKAGALETVERNETGLFFRRSCS